MLQMTDTDWCMCGKKAVTSGFYCATHCRIKDAGYPNHPIATHSAPPPCHNLSYYAEHVPLVTLKRTTSLVKDLCQLSFEDMTPTSGPDYFDPLPFLEESRLRRVPPLATRCSFTSNISEKRRLEESSCPAFDFEGFGVATEEASVLDFKRRKLRATLSGKRVSHPPAAAVPPPSALRMMSDLNWCSCGKATQQGSLYCSQQCKDGDEASSRTHLLVSSWSLDPPISVSSPIAFYPHNHIANVLNSPHINPNIPANLVSTPLLSATASPRFTGSSTSSARVAISAINSPFAFTSLTTAGTGAANASTQSIPFLALPQSELDLPPLALEDAKPAPTGTPSTARRHPPPAQGNHCRKPSRGGGIAYPSTRAIHSSPYLTGGTHAPASPSLGARGTVPPSPLLNGRVGLASPQLHGSLDLSSNPAGTGAGEGGLVTVAGGSAMVDDFYVSLAFHNRGRK
ncbi:hypothetical protein BC830DRAFT_1079899 [Chytriomyces sp. MP71]|nr:hypothetical protein BC830DRAFT_1079899 [Chytriomyces sp. MP71]